MRFTGQKNLRRGDRTSGCWGPSLALRMALGIKIKSKADYKEYKLR